MKYNMFFVDVYRHTGNLARADEKVLVGYRSGMT